jgi:hypothetical protein
MEAAVHRRLTVAVSWALARRATLDYAEHFEESLALTEEFGEWLLCLDDNPQALQDSVLMVPRHLSHQSSTVHQAPGRENERDDLLEI